jgi:hypothetical protein
MKYASDRNSVVAIFETHGHTEKTIKELQRCGHDMRNLSIAGQAPHVEGQTVGYYLAGGRMKRSGGGGSVWGISWAVLQGSGYFAIPEVGSVLVAGPLVSWMVTEIENGFPSSEATAIGAGLHKIGVPIDFVSQYEDAIRTGKLVVVAHGTVSEVEKAKSIMEAAHPTAVGLYTSQSHQAELATVH